MSAARQLRILGLILMVSGAIGAVAGIGTGILLWKTVPIRTVGAHGMLPESLHSDLFAVLAVDVGAAAAVAAACGWALRAENLLAELCALAVGLGACVFAVFATTSAWLPSPPVLAPLVGGYFIGLAFTAWRERRKREGGRADDATTVRGRLRRQALGTLMIAALVSGGSFAWAKAHPSELAQVFEQARERRESAAPAVSATPPGASASGATPVVAPRAAQSPRGDSADYVSDDAWHACAKADHLDQFCGGATSLAVEPRGLQLASASLASGGAGHVISLWERRSGARLWSVTVPVKEDPYQTLVFSPDGRFLAFHNRWEATLLSAEHGDIVRSIERCGEPGKNYPWPPPNIAVAFSPNSKELIVGGDGLCETKADTGDLVRRFAVHVCYATEGLAYSADGSQLASLCGLQLTFWNAKSLEPAGELPHGMRSDPKHVEPNPGNVEAFRLSRDGKTILTRNGDFTGKHGLWLWNAATLHEIYVTSVPFFGAPSPLELLPDGKTALIGGQTAGKPGLHVLDASTGQERKVVLEDTSVMALAMPVDASFFLVGRRASYPSKRPSIVTLTPADLE
jgi:WD40 repeat protein